MTPQQKEEWRMDIIMLIASAKLLSDQSTYLNGELSREMKHDFNLMVRATDHFIKRVEGTLSPDVHGPLQEITDALNNKCTEIRKQINELV